MSYLLFLYIYQGFTAFHPQHVVFTKETFPCVVVVVVFHVGGIANASQQNESSRLPSAVLPECKPGPSYEQPEPDERRDSAVRHAVLPPPPRVAFSDGQREWEEVRRLLCPLGLPGSPRRGGVWSVPRLSSGEVASVGGEVHARGLTPRCKLLSYFDLLG